MDLSGEAARENSIPGNADFSQQMIYGPDVVDPTRSNVLTHDSTTGQIHLGQLNSSNGATLATGIIAPQYSAGGPPGPATLA